MAQLSVGSAEPAGFVGTAGAQRPPPIRRLDCPRNFLARVALRGYPYVREHEGWVVRWMDGRGKCGNTCDRVSVQQDVCWTEEHTEIRGDRFMSEVRRQVAMPPRPSWAWQDAGACRGKDIVLFFGPDGERQ